jgi:branched-chain amino acid transport system permease protein
MVVSRFVALMDAGLAQGCIAGLIALGIVLLYKATGVVNFAQGSLLTLGGYVGFWLEVKHQVGVLPEYILTVAAVAAVGMVIERVGYAPLRRQPVQAILISTFALALALQAVIILWQGSAPKTLPPAVGSSVWHLFGAAIPHQNILIIVMTVVLLGGLMFLLQRTALGRQVRALAADRETAMLQGVRVSLLSLVMFGLSAGLAGLGGLLVAPTISLSPDFGFTLMLSSFAAVVLGGFDRVGGTVFAAVVVGVVQQILTGYVEPNLSEAYPYLILVVALIIRPEGLIRESVRVRY